MKVGVTLPARYPFESTRRVLGLYGDDTIDSYWAPDHILGVFHPQLWADVALSTMSSDPDGYYDPFCYGALVGSMTRRPFGVCVTDGTRRRAADLARTALTLNDLIPGGFILGIGSGEAESLIPFGYPFDRPVDLLEQCLIELRSLIDEGTMPGTGVGRMGLPRDLQDRGKPAIWVAGHGPRMLRLTGEYGDGWVPAWAMPPEQYGAKREIVAAHAQASGRPVPEAAMVPFTVVAESVERAAAMFEREPLSKLFALFAMGSTWEAHGVQHPLGNESRGFIDVIVHDLDGDDLRDIAPTIPFELVNEVLFIGNAEELAARLTPYRQAGLDHVVLANFTGLVGGVDEVVARGPGFVDLVAILRDL